MPPIVREKRAPLERDIQAAIRLELGREADLVMWRNAQTYAEIFDDNGPRAARGGLGTGSSDLVGILRFKVYASRADIVEGKYHSTGRFFALEIKRPGKDTTPEQKRFLALVRSFGGFAAAVHSIDEAWAALARARKGDNE